MAETSRPEAVLQAYVEALLDSRSSPSEETSTPEQAERGGVYSSASVPEADGIIYPDLGNSIECVVLRVGAVSLALPARRVKRVIHDAGADNGLLRTVDARALTGAGGAAGAPRCLVVMDRGDWALAGDTMGKPFTLSRAQACWRSERTQRWWLAATVREPCCALLDVDAIAKNFIARH